MPNDREMIDLESIIEEFTTTRSITLSTLNDAADNLYTYNPVPISYHCMICGESVNIDRPGYTLCICDDCIDTIKFMKEVKKNIVKRKGKCNESKQPKE